MMRYSTVLSMALLWFVCSCDHSTENHACPPCMSYAVILTLVDDSTKQQITDAKIAAYKIVEADTVPIDSFLTGYHENAYSIPGGPGRYGFDIIHPDYDTICIPPFCVDTAVNIPCSTTLTEHLEIQIQKTHPPAKRLESPGYNIIERYTTPSCG